MKNFLKKIQPWQILLALILLVAAFLRFYNLENSLMFLADQGRDVILVAKIFKELDPVFIGPITSIGNMYLGPFYYYFMLPFLILSYPSPMGPVYGVAILSLITVFLLFKITDKLFNRKTALIATSLFALSSVVIEFSRFSWNPNIAPFFGLLMFYYSYMAWKKDSKYWILVSICFSLLIQLHYVALLSLGGAGLVYLLQLKDRLTQKNKKENKKLIKHTILAILIFLLSLTPLMLFDFKHDWTNARAFGKIFSQEESFDLEKKEGREGSKAITQYFTVDLRDKGRQILFETSFGENQINNYLLYLTVIFLLIYISKNRKKFTDQEIVLAAYLSPSVIGISLYQHNVYMHYITFLFPLIYIFYALIFDKIKNKKLFLALFLPFLGYFIYNNALRYPLKDNSWGIREMKEVADSIYERVEADDVYNISSITHHGDHHGINYRYFLSTRENQPAEIEETHAAKKLFIIDEIRSGEKVVDSPIYQIVIFEDKNPKEVYQLDSGPEITVLSIDENAYNEE